MTACNKKTATEIPEGASSNPLGFQLELPKPDEEIAVVTTSLGVIKIRLFPEQAPKAVESFTKLANDGYYDGIIFHRVIEGFMIQGGDPTGTGRGGKSAFGAAFKDEFVPNLVNIRGSLAMANSGPNTNGSQFFINQAKKEKITSSVFESGLNASRVTDKYKDIYTDNGGNLNLDGYYSSSGKGHTVFGQVFDGMSVVDEIAAVKTDANDKPLSSVKMTTVRIEKYDGTVPEKETSQPAAESSEQSSVAASSSPQTEIKGGKLGMQLDKPQKGEEIAVMQTTAGTMKIRLFPEQAPKAVENFKTLAKNKYYEGIIFHRVIKDFMIQGGDPTGTGTGGQSAFGAAFEDEFAPNAVNLRGSLAMANSGPATNGSQFFINQSKKENFNFSQVSSWLDPSKVTDEYKKLYEENGGNAHLDGYYRTSGGHTVFGQVFEGMDVVDAIAETQVGAGDKPVTDIKIVKVEIIKY